MLVIKQQTQRFHFNPTKHRTLHCIRIIFLHDNLHYKFTTIAL